MTIVVSVLYFALGLDPWVWLVPIAIAGLVLIKWTMRPTDQDLDDLSDEAEID
jgi:hypothetical protein